MNQRQKCSGDGGLRFTAVAALSSLSSVTPPSPDRLISVQVPRMKKGGIANKGPRRRLLHEETI
jgi:hypothetical protein